MKGKGTSLHGLNPTTGSSWEEEATTSLRRTYSSGLKTIIRSNLEEEGAAAEEDRREEEVATSPRRASSSGLDPAVMHLLQGKERGTRE